MDNRRPDQLVAVRIFLLAMIGNLILLFRTKNKKVRIVCHILNLVFLILLYPLGVKKAMKEVIGEHTGHEGVLERDMTIAGIPMPAGTKLHLMERDTPLSFDTAVFPQPYDWKGMAVDSISRAIEHYRIADADWSPKWPEEWPLESDPRPISYKTPDERNGRWDEYGHIVTRLPQGGRFSTSEGWTCGGSGETVVEWEADNHPYDEEQNFPRSMNDFHFHACALAEPLVIDIPALPGLGGIRAAGIRRREFNITPQWQAAAAEKDGRMSGDKVLLDENKRPLLVEIKAQAGRYPEQCPIGSDYTLIWRADRPDTVAIDAPAEPKLPETCFGKKTVRAEKPAPDEDAASAEDTASAAEI